MMVKLLTTNYAGRLGRILEERAMYLKIQWTQNPDGSPIGFASWVHRPGKWGQDEEPEVEILF
jgi:hypothetical protein